MAQEIFPDAQHILDLFHLKENVYGFAKARYKQDAACYVPWAERICGLLEDGHWEAVLQKRMKQAGMRWNPETAQYLVTLCSKKESGCWEKDVDDFVRKMLQPGTKQRNNALHSIQAKEVG